MPVSVFVCRLIKANRILWLMDLRDCAVLPQLCELPVIELSHNKMFTSQAECLKKKELWYDYEHSTIYDYWQSSFRTIFVVIANHVAFTATHDTLCRVKKVGLRLWRSCGTNQWERNTVVVNMAKNTCQKSEVISMYAHTELGHFHVIFVYLLWDQHNIWR